MKEDLIRYWSVEHLGMMLIAIALVTISRIAIKKLDNGKLKFRRLFIYNLIALVIILASIVQSGRGIV